MKTYPIFEPLSIQEGCSLNCKVFSGSSFFCPVHLHPEYELVFLSQGGVNSIVGDSRNQLKQHQLLLVGPNLPHAFSSIDDGNSFTSHYIHLKQPLLEALPHQFQELFKLETIIDFFKQGAIFTLQQEQITLYKKIYTYHGEQRLFALLTFLLSLTQQTPLSYQCQSYSQDTSQLVRKIISCIEENSQDPLPLTKIASEMSMSVPTFTRRFKRLFGVTYVEYLIGLKVDKACHLLNCSSSAITYIAWEAGFTSVSQFNKQFKQNVGVSPKVYREEKLYRQKNQSTKASTSPGEKIDWDVGDSY